MTENLQPPIDLTSHADIADNESVYDAEIAPLLLQVADRCKELGMPFIASVEFAPGSIGKTEVVMHKMSFAQRLAHYAVRAYGNVDKLILGINKYAKEYGHSSVFLQSIGNTNVVETENQVTAFAITTTRK